MNWPIGCGVDFKGVYDREKKEVLVRIRSVTRARTAPSTRRSLSMDNEAGLSRSASASGGTAQLNATMWSLLDGAGYEFDHRRLYRSGESEPRFLRLGADELRRGAVSGELSRSHDAEPARAPVPMACRSRPHGQTRFLRLRIQDPGEHEQGAPRPASRSCASARASLSATRNTTTCRAESPSRSSQPQQMMAEERQIIDEAYAGDIIGVFDPGIFSIGDTICSQGQERSASSGIPTFAPEHFAAFEPQGHDEAQAVR